MTRQELTAYIFDTYSVEPDYPFREDSVTCVFRHTVSRKWFGIVMKLPYRTLGLPRDGTVDILISSLIIGMLMHPGPPCPRSASPCQGEVADKPQAWLTEGWKPGRK